MIGYKKYNEPVWKCPFNANLLLDYDYNSLDAEMMDGWMGVGEWMSVFLKRYRNFKEIFIYLKLW